MDLKKILRLSYWLNFIKFNVVGLSGVLVNEGLLLALVYERVFYLHADAVAIEASILSNFFLNDYWTFRDRRHGHIAVRLLKFNALMVIGLVVNLTILYAFTAYLGINYAVSNLFGIAVAFLLRYWLSIRFTWIKKEEASTSPT
ncbi:MAG: GtrA family protein [Nitrososphaerota archaeon]|jgi:dolichol-phosphate mannosyltransferase|nr:GtrA family protein [Nitrososphaerota archaeon]MDG6937054.1 GtrA family protein [Nitrososphaerota archaeon]MDG6961143.1 GtrA family protein [Nitrososphaerota archaeon]MDG6968143.1 GtrA family protein [Nitrososphaerota archaeon]MDG6970526.1 GtrA family protein [Nitrososphaerota archaeon]